jgi:hypothetical protein
MSALVEMWCLPSNATTDVIDVVNHLRGHTMIWHANDFAQAIA